MSKFGSGIWLFTGGLLLACCATAQQPDIGDGLPSAQQVIEKYIQARGGEMPLFGLSSVRMKGHIDVLAGSAGWSEVEFHWKGGNWRSSFTGGRRDVFRGSYGGRFWVANSTAGPRWADEEETRRLTCINRSPDLSQSWIEFDGQIRVEGEERINERNTWRVEFTHNNGESVTRWFDIESGLLAQASYISNDRRLITTSDEYRDVDGVVFSIKATTTYPESGLVVQVVMDEIEVNGSFPESRILPPQSLLDQDSPK